MAELVCPTCGTSYDVSDYEPGQRFRCRGDGCTEKLTVPAGGADDTATPVPPAEPPRRAAGKRRKPTGKVLAATPAAPVDEDPDNVLEAKVPTARAQRTDTARRPQAAGPVRGRSVPPKPASPAPLYAGIGGGLVLLLIVIYALMGTPVNTESRRPKKPTVPDWKQEKTLAPAATTAAADGTAGVEAPSTPADDGAKPKPAPRVRKDWRFVEKDGLQAKMLPLLDQVGDEDPNVAADATATLTDIGPDLVPVLLNHMAGLKFLSRKERQTGFQLLEIVKEHLGDTARDKVGDVGEVNPLDNGAFSFRDAVKAWREYLKGTGAATTEIEVSD